MARGECRAWTAFWLVLALTLGQPAAADRSAGALRRSQAELLKDYAGDAQAIPLHAKALHFEELLWRYHLTPWNQVDPRVVLPERAGGELRYEYGADVSTWNGVLLAALTYRYAVTRDPRTLERIETLLEGLHLFQRVTRRPGLAARVVLRSDAPVGRATQRWVAPDGASYFYRGDPAKGTYIQLVAGYATLLHWVQRDLGEATREQPAADLNALVLHLVSNDYRITGEHGRPTRYGNLRPRFFGFPVPFNAQATAMMLAAGRRFPSGDPVATGRIAAAFAEMRRQRPFYRSPWLPPFYTPQGVGKSRFVDANDLHHLATATHAALSLYRGDLMRSTDSEWIQQLGQTWRGIARKLPRQRNAVVNFAWAATLEDSELSEAILGRHRSAARGRLTALLHDAVEQLRRYPIDRFRTTGRERNSRRKLFWIDDYRPDSYFWKVDPGRRWETSGPATNLLTAAIDYLHAYWLFRCYGLDRMEAMRARHDAVLAAPGGHAACTLQALDVSAR